MTSQGRGGKQTKESPVKSSKIFNYLSTDATPPPPSAKVRVCVLVLVSDSGGAQSAPVGDVYSQICILTDNSSIILVYEASDPQRLLGYVFLLPQHGRETRNRCHKPRGHQSWPDRKYLRQNNDLHFISLTLLSDYLETIHCLLLRVREHFHD